MFANRLLISHCRIAALGLSQFRQIGTVLSSLSVRRTRGGVPAFDGAVPDTSVAQSLATLADVLRYCLNRGSLTYAAKPCGRQNANRIGCSVFGDGRIRNGASPVLAKTVKECQAEWRSHK